MKRSTTLAFLLTLGVALVQPAFAGPPSTRGSSPPPQGSGPPPARRPPSTTPKRVCIDVSVSKPQINILPPRAWPFGVKPDGKTAYVNMTTTIRNHSSTDLNEPVEVIFSVFDPRKGGWKTFMEVEHRRGLRAGATARLQNRRYYVVGPWPANAPVRAELKGTQGERNDCSGRNDISGAVSTDFQRLATQSANL